MWVNIFGIWFYDCYWLLSVLVRRLNLVNLVCFGGKVSGIGKCNDLWKINVVFLMEGKYCYVKIL